MSFKDDMNQYRAQQKSGYYTDEEIYQRLIESWISSTKLYIKNYIRENPSSNHYHSIESIQWLFKFYASSYDEFIHKFKDDSPVYKKDEYGYNDAIYIRDLFTISKNGSKVTVDLSPLGKRALNDINNKAKEDGITISEPIVHYEVHYKSMFGKEKCDKFRKKLGESFSAHKGEKETCDVFIEVDFDL